MTPDERERAIEDAQSAMRHARIIADYHGWTGASANRYAVAKRDLRALRRQQRRAGCRRLVWRPAHTLLALSTILSVLAVWAMYQAAH